MRDSGVAPAWASFHTLPETGIGLGPDDASSVTLLSSVFRLIQRAMCSSGHATSRRRTDLHGGGIHIDNLTGDGVTFTMRLPLFP